jgi:hypothetical protein
VHQKKPINIECVGKMQSFQMLKQVLHDVITVL